MPRILVKVAFGHSDNGWKVNDYEAGEEYDVSENCAALMLSQKFGEIVEVPDVEDEGDAANGGDDGSGSGGENGDGGDDGSGADDDTGGGGSGTDDGSGDDGSQNEDPEKSETGKSETEDNGSGGTAGGSGDPPPAVKITPTALSLATENSIDPASLTGTGTDGMVTVEDVRVAVKAAEKASE